jgi:cystathionine beta-lyase
MPPMPEAAIAAFFDALSLFGIGFSWGGYESLAVRVRPERARTITPWTEPGAVVRIHAGLEDVDDLRADLGRAFAAMARAAP